MRLIDGLFSDFGMSSSLKSGLASEDGHNIAGLLKLVARSVTSAVALDGAQTFIGFNL